jgi:hypothetical protein
MIVVWESASDEYGRSGRWKPVPRSWANSLTPPVTHAVIQSLTVFSHEGACGSHT